MLSNPSVMLLNSRYFSVVWGGRCIILSSSTNGSSIPISEGSASYSCVSIASSAYLRRLIVEKMFSGWFISGPRYSKVPILFTLKGPHMNFNAGYPAISFVGKRLLSRSFSHSFFFMSAIILRSASVNSYFGRLPNIGR